MSERDALADEILRDPRIAPGGGDGFRSPAEQEAFRAWLSGAASTYEGTRVAAADLTTAAVSAGVGAFAFKEFTPGMMSLGPATAQVLVQNAAIAGFPLGSGAGALWYGVFPAAAPVALSIGLTGGLLAAGAVVAAFSGVVTDPIQRRLGLHHRRLGRLIDCLERELTGQGDSRFTVRDHYVARTLDVIEALGLVWRGHAVGRPPRKHLQETPCPPDPPRSLRRCTITFRPTVCARTRSCAACARRPRVMSGRECRSRLSRAR